MAQKILGNILTYEKPTYKLLKIKPDSRLTNTCYDNLIMAVYSTYEGFQDRLSYTSEGMNGSIHLAVNNPITYEVLFDGDNKKTTPLFYFCIPENKSGYMKQRIQAILPNSTLTFEDDEMVNCINATFTNCFCYEYLYAKDDMLAIKTKDNNFLESILNVKNDILKGESLLFQIEMKPISNYWKSAQEEKWNKVRAGKDVTNKRTAFDIGLDSINSTIDSVLSIMDDIVEYKPPKKDVTPASKASNLSTFSTASRQKKNFDGFSVSIRLYVAGCDRDKANSYGMIFETCMRELEEDNRLVMYKTRKPKSLDRGRLCGRHNIMNIKEVASIVNIPNQRLQRTFHIDAINMKVNNIPKELIDNGGIRIGTDEFHGETRTICLPQTKRSRCIHRVYISPMGGGKSNLFLNNIVDSIKIGNGVVLIDHINVGEMTKGMADIFGGKVVVRNPKSVEDGFGFYFPEMYIKDMSDINDRLDTANDIAYEVQYLINSIAVNSEPLTEVMNNFLFAACKIVFIHNGKTLKNFINVLLDEETRHEYIELAISQGVLSNKSFEIKKMLELDKDVKPIKGLLDRICVLQRDSLFQRMLDRPYNQDDSFIRYFDNQIPLSIVLTNEDFPSKKKKDILCTFLLGRIRLAMSKRNKRDKVCDVYIDEPQQLKNTLKTIAESMFEVRKYGMDYVFALQNIDQLGDLKEDIINNGCHFFLLKGCGESTFNAVKSKIGDEFEYSDVAEMEKWHSFNLVSIDNSYHAFITKYPDMLTDKTGNPYIGD